MKLKTLSILLLLSSSAAVLADHVNNGRAGVQVTRSHVDEGRIHAKHAEKEQAKESAVEQAFADRPEILQRIHATESGEAVPAEGGRVARPGAAANGRTMSRRLDSDAPVVASSKKVRKTTRKPARKKSSAPVAPAAE